MSIGYVAPASLDEALAFLAERGPDSSILAGGMSVVPALKQGRLASKFIVNIKGIGDLSLPTPEIAGQRLAIGALVRHREIESSPLIAEHFPALRALEEKLASVQIRNHGTLAGNLCAAEVWSDPPCLLAALDARLTVVAKCGQREVAAADWILGDGKTQRCPDELVWLIHLPLPCRGDGTGYARLAARQGLARPLACAAARVWLADNGAIATARVFVGAVGPRPQRMREVEAMLAGHRLDRRLSDEIKSAVGKAVESFPDVRCGTAYKAQVAGVLVQRAIANAVENARSAEQ